MSKYTLLKLNLLRILLEVYGLSEWESSRRIQYQNRGLRGELFAYGELWWVEFFLSMRRTVSYVKTALEIQNWKSLEKLSYGTGVNIPLFYDCLYYSHITQTDVR